MCDRYRALSKAKTRCYTYGENVLGRADSPDFGVLLPAAVDVPRGRPVARSPQDIVLDLNEAGRSPARPRYSGQAVWGVELGDETPVSAGTNVVPR